MWTHEVLDLGTDLSPFGISDNGSVVGIQRGTSTGFVWKNGIAKSLPPLNGDDDSFAFDINSSGRAVGSSSSAGSSRACIWSPQGIPTAIESQGYSEARSINDAGVVAGQFNSTPVVWKNGQRVQLPTTGYSVPTSVGNRARGNSLCLNSASDAVGFNGSSLTGKPVSWPSGGGVVALSAPGKQYGMAASVNSGLMVVGEQVVNPPNPVSPTPWIWTLIGAGPLALPPPAIRGGATSVNDSGLIVGTLWHDNVFDRHAYSWFGPVATLLDNLVDAASGWKLLTAEAVNNKGEVVGTGSLSGSEPRGYVLRRVVKPRRIKVPPETWHLIYGVHGDGPGWIMGKKGPIRVPPWTPYIRSLAREVRPMVELLLDTNRLTKVVRDR